MIVANILTTPSANGAGEHDDVLVLAPLAIDFANKGHAAKDRRPENGEWKDKLIHSRMRDPHILALNREVRDAADKANKFRHDSLCPPTQTNLDKGHLPDCPTDERIMGFPLLTNGTGR